MSSKRKNKNKSSVTSSHPSQKPPKADSSPSSQAPQTANNLTKSSSTICTSEPELQPSHHELYSLNHQIYEKFSSCAVKKINSISESIQQGISFSRRKEQGSSQQSFLHLTGSLEELESLRTLLSDYCEALLKNADLVYSEIAVMKQSVLHISTSSKEANTSLQQELEEVKKDRAAIAYSVEALIQTNNTLQTALSALTEEYSRMDTPISSNEATSSLQQELEEANTAKVILSQNIKELEEKLSSLGEVNSNLQLTLEAGREERASLKLRISLLNARLLRPAPPAPSSSSLSSSASKTSSLSQVPLVQVETETQQSCSDSLERPSSSHHSHIGNQPFCSSAEVTRLKVSQSHPPPRPSFKKPTTIQLIIKNLPLDTPKDLIISSLHSHGNISPILGKSFVYSRSAAFSQVVIVSIIQARMIMNSATPSVQIGYNTFPIAFYIHYFRCSKCQELGHLSKNCRNSITICASCGDNNHPTENCPNNNNPLHHFCSNCDAYNKTNPAFRVNPHHKASSNSCHSFRHFVATQTANRYAFLFTSLYHNPPQNLLMPSSVNHLLHHNLTTIPFQPLNN